MEYREDRHRINVEREGLERFTLRPGEREARYDATFFRKSPHWRYEQEIRIVATLDDPHVSSRHKPPGVTHFPADLVAEIVIGSRTPVSVMNAIYEARDKTFPPAELKVAWLDSTKFRVNVRKAPPLFFMRDTRNKQRLS